MSIEAKCVVGIWTLCGAMFLMIVIASRIVW